jgi:hypothetical protein
MYIKVDKSIKANNHSNHSNYLNHSNYSNHSNNKKTFIMMNHFIQKFNKFANPFTKKTKIKPICYTDGVKDTILDEPQSKQDNLNECSMCFKDYHLYEECSLDNCIHTMCFNCMFIMLNNRHVHNLYTQCAICMKPFSDADFSRMKGMVHIMHSKKINEIDHPLLGHVADL